MPHGYVKTIEDTIFYYYAKLVIAKSAGFEHNFGFITDSFKKLKSGRITMSDYDREIEKQMNSRNVCVYCGKKSDSFDHVIPRSLGGPVGTHNEVKSCKHCNSSKGDRDLIDGWHNQEVKEYDELPRNPIGIYLKFSHDWHKMNHSLGMPANDLGDLKPFDRRR